MMKYLIITSKWPQHKVEIDGGCMTGYNVFEVLREFVSIDILVPKTLLNISISKECDNVIHYDCPEEIETSYNGEEKFHCRIKIADIIYNRVKDKLHLYDKIIVLHSFHIFRIVEHASKDILEKIILFPMFSVPSYLECNEQVPDSFIALENEVMRRVGKIITPSQYEKDKIVSFYKLDCNKIVVLPRYIGDEFTHRPLHKIEKKCVHLCYIASFRKQKQHTYIVTLLKLFRDMGVNVHVYCVGSIQDTKSYYQFISDITQADLNDRVTICKYMSQIDINNLFHEMDFNISVAACETFGRAIIEGLKVGVPVIILDCYHRFRNLLPRCNCIFFANTISEMVNIIISNLEAPDKYKSMQVEAQGIGDSFTKELLFNRLRYELC